MRPVKIHAFTLIEILIVVAIISGMFALSVPTIMGLLEKSQLDAESNALNAIRDDIIRSFDSTDFASVNIAALAGDVPSGVPTTVFTGNPDGDYIATSAADWYAKIAAIRGSGFGPAAPGSQPAVKDILYNHYGRARGFVAAAPQPRAQRFLLFSIMAPNAQLVMPPNDGTPEWFEAIWNTEWDTKGGAIPAYWTARLSADQQAAWNGSAGSGSRLYLMRVIRITLPRYVLRISNNHPTGNGYIYFNNGMFVEAPAESGVTESPAILGGRQIVVKKGADEASAIETNRFLLRDDSDVFIQ
jgi:prepilin-type N-terminal cleavage/methylation domain-containing protein